MPSHREAMGAQAALYLERVIRDVQRELALPAEEAPFSSIKLLTAAKERSAKEQQQGIPGALRAHQVIRWQLGNLYWQKGLELMPKNKPLDYTCDPAVRKAAELFKLAGNEDCLPAMEALIGLYTAHSLDSSHSTRIMIRRMMDRAEEHTLQYDIAGRGDLRVSESFNPDEDFLAASDCFHQGRMEESFDLFIRSAEKNLTKPQVQAYIRYNLGIIIENGYLGEPNYGDAYDLFIYAAKQGVSRAKYHLAGLVYNGKPGVPADADLCFRMASEAYQERVIHGLRYLSLCVDSGKGTAPSREKALALIGDKTNHYDELLSLRETFAAKDRAKGKRFICRQDEKGEAAFVLA